MTAAYTPARDTPAEARRRALRAFLEGLAFDVGVGVVLAVGPELLGAEFAWTSAYWTTMGTLAGKSAIQAGVTYLLRRLRARRNGGG